MIGLEIVPLTQDGPNSALQEVVFVFFFSLFKQEDVLKGWGAVAFTGERTGRWRSSSEEHDEVEARGYWDGDWRTALHPTP